MNKYSKAIGFIVLAFAVMSCSLAEKFIPGGPQLSKTGDLWPDVPKMDGFATSDLELPLAIKVLMRTALNNLWRFNKPGEDKTPATGDWIVFSTTSLPADVQNFYTNTRMSSFGNWEANKSSTCLDGKNSGINGVLCVFQKTADQKQIGLAIIAMLDDQTKKTNIFFLRVEQPADPNAANKPASISNKP